MEYRVLGPVEVVGDAGAIPLGPPKQRALLALLVLRSGTVVSRRELAADLWPGAAPAQVEHNLAVYVSRLRKLIASAGGSATALALVGDGYVLGREGATTDLDRFLRLVTQGRAAVRAGDAALAVPLLRQALGVWRGPALADTLVTFTLENEGARLEELRLTALEDVFEAELDLGHEADLVYQLEQLVESHPTRERLAESLLLALYRMGRHGDALLAYRDHRLRLSETFGLEPHPRVQALEKAILVHDRRLEKPRVVAPIRGLPAYPTSFVGRSVEVERVAQLLVEGRLVTVTGPGGVGKTRLAVEVARRFAATFPDGVFFVDLAAVTRADDVEGALARRLGVRPSPEEAMTDALIRRLEARRALIVFDNFEHVVAAAPVASSIVRGAEAVSVLATSRRPLRLYGEHVVALEPLPTDSEAVELLTARLGTAVDRETAVDICRALDGLPLAIELAAARAHHVQAFVDTPNRQRSLDETFLWTYRLLDQRGRRAIRSLAVFRGGFDVGAASTVADADEVMIATLEELSLVMRRGDRYGILEPIRTAAWAEVERAGEADELRARHAAWFAGLAADAEPQLSGGAQQAWLEKLDVDQSNLLDAIEHLIGVDTAAAFRLLTATRTFWEARGDLDRLLRIVGPAEPEDVDALIAFGGILGRSGAQARAVELTERASAAARGDREVAMVHGALAWTALIAGDPGRSRELGAIGVAAARRENDDALLAEALNIHGAAVADTGDIADGIAHYEEAVALRRALGDRAGLCATLGNVAELLWALGRRDRALLVQGEALDIAREVGDQWVTVLLLEHSAWMAIDAGDLVAAARHLDEALVRAVASGHQGLIAACLARSAVLAAQLGAPEDAARLRAADAEISAAHGLGAPRATAVVPGADAVVSAELGRESGSGLAVDEAVALARRVTAQTIAG